MKEHRALTPRRQVARLQRRQRDRTPSDLSPEHGAPAEAPALQPDLVIAGYRVVRLLGSGKRAVVFLGHSSSAEAVALKVFQAHAHAATIELELEVLTSSAAPYLVRLLDVAHVDDDRVCFVLERLTGGTLVRYLADHAPFSPGEAVTVLAPIVVGLSALHAAGFQHGGISVSTVLLTPNGQAVISGLGTAQRLSDVPRERLRQVKEDWNRLGELVACVLEVVRATDAQRSLAADFLRHFRHAAGTAKTPAPHGTQPDECRPVLETLERDLFAWAVAAPLRAFERARLSPESNDSLPLEIAGSYSPSGVAQAARDLREHQSAGLDAGTWPQQSETGCASDRVSPPVSPFATSRRAVRSARRKGTARVPVRAVGVALRSTVRVILDSHPLKEAGHHIRRRFQHRQRPLLIAVLGGSSLVILALTVFPLTDPAGGATSSTDPAGSDTMPVTTPLTTLTPTPLPHTLAPADAENPVPLLDPDRPSITGEDPVAAVVALLATRARCLTAVSLVCLVEVDQTGSAILTSDGYIVRQAQHGAGDVPFETYQDFVPSLAEHQGNLAVVALTPAAGQEKRQSASVLVIKGEDGWRLRDIFDY